MIPIELTNAFIPKPSNILSTYETQLNPMVEKVKPNMQIPPKIQDLHNEKFSYNMLDSEMGKGNINLLDDIIDHSEINLKRKIETEKPKEVYNAQEGLKKNNQKKKEKNRVSAQKCRIRKKQYIESLEATINELTKELEKCKEELRLVKEMESENLATDVNAIKHHKNYTNLIMKLKSTIEDSNPKGVIHQLLGEINVILLINYRW